MRLGVALTIGTTFITAAALGVAVPASAHQAERTVASASVTRAAQNGGPVIITLRRQFPDLKIKSQGRQRRTATHDAQRGLVSELRSHGATDIRRLVSIDAVAATVPKAEIARLRADPSIAAVQRDSLIRVAAATSPTAATPGSAASRTAMPATLPGSSAPGAGICPADPSKPLLEPEALSDTHYLSQPARPDDAATIATGKGVKIGLTGINRLAGNPNFIRPDGEHVVVDSPTPNADDSNTFGGGDEWYGDASSISGQGTVTYDFAHELPYSHLPSGCTFKIVGIAPGASLVDTGYFGQKARNSGNGTEPESQVIAGLDHAAIDDQVTVVSESYGFGSVPGYVDFSALRKANDSLVAAGITVVESAGDSGTGGTVEMPADDPLVIDAGATNTLRLNALAWSYRTWENDQITPLSSGGTTARNDVVDLVAPGFGGEATCSPKSATCPPDTQTEAFGGTSQAAPFIAGAAADVIQAYAESHHGAKPSPALVKQILTGTARDLGASSDDQGAGLLDVYAAVRAAQQEPDSTVTSDAAALVPSPTQVNVAGEGGTSSTHTVSLYNASDSPTTVTGSSSSLGATRQIGSTVTEPVTAPASSAALPDEGATAAAPVSMHVAPGVSELGVDFITPNPKNDAILSLLLFDPEGRLSQISYDYSSTTGKVSNNQHVAIDKPMAGTWTAKVVWNNGRSHLQDPPPVPGNYRGDISVRFTARQMRTTSFGSPVTIAPHASADVAVPVTLPTTPGDAPQTATFTASNGVSTQVPVTRRTLIPSQGGSFTATLGSSVARDFGPLKSFQIDVPAGRRDMQVAFDTADARPDNVISYFLIAPDGKTSTYDRSPDTTPRGAEARTQRTKGDIVVANPRAGRWTVQVLLDLTTSGREFTQDVHGTVAYDTAKVVTTGVPQSSTATVPQGGPTRVHATITNTTGIGRQFTLTSPTGFLSAPKVYIPAGSTATVRGTLRPTSAVGTKVNNKIEVLVCGSDVSPLLSRDGYAFPPQTLYIRQLKFVVGPPANG